MTEEQNSGSNVPQPLIVFHHSELSKIEREEEDAKQVVKAITARKKKYRKTIQADGIKLANFDFARKLLMADEDEVKADLAETGAILRAFKAPLGHQFDLFSDPDGAPLNERWFYQGYLVGARAGHISECPHRQGDKGHKPWMDGYKAAQAAIVLGMQQSQASKDEGEDGGDAPVEAQPDDEAPVAEAEAAEGAGDTLADDEVGAVDDPLDPDESDWEAERDAELAGEPAEAGESLTVQ